MPLSYDDVLARNIRAERGRNRLGQANVVARMRALGYDSWHRQTLGKIERGERRIVAYEILGLALALNTSVPILLTPSPNDGLIMLPSEEDLPAAHISALVYGRNLGAIAWDGDKPVFTNQAHPQLKMSPDGSTFGYEHPFWERDHTSPRGDAE